MAEIPYIGSILCEIWSKDEMIKYLVARKFPVAKALRSTSFPVGRGVRIPTGMTPDQEREYLKNATSYETELALKTENELKKLFEEECKKDSAEKARKVEIEESKRIFNTPEAIADFDYWAKMPGWSLEEAIALSFGKNPRVVNWDSIKRYTDSAFAKEYYNRRDIAIRAKNWKDLYDPIMPCLFLTWLKTKRMDFPAELEAQVIANGGHVVNWKTAYENLKKTYDDLVSTQNEIIELKDSTIIKLGENFTRLEKQYEAIKQQLLETEKKQTEKPLKTRERETALKLIIGIAVDSYGYDPKAIRSPTAKEISGDLAKHGISIDEDTVRKWLKEAAEILPQNS